LQSRKRRNEGETAKETVETQKRRNTTLNNVVEMPEIG